MDLLVIDPLESLLVALRDRSALSVIDVASRLGMSRASIYAWEDAADRRRPSAKDLGRLLALYGVAEDDAVSLRAYRLLASTPALAGD